MKIDHIAIWTNNLEELRSFYMKYFGANSNEKYFNPTKKFSSYFLSFDEGCTIEIMEMPDIPKSKNDVYKQFAGLIHFAINVGSKTEVDNLTKVLRTNGYKVVGEPRTTGDGCYESVILDPDGNRVEIVA
ncbi:MAG: glyoxalase/bleomycin resistance/extradiol dioxygenase family protein [Prolixibacteraceae bacterium]|jgi:lactoylglutathione lyase|nr:glyoxalase/bleomycin resistance/extradiol dioxygenase family protein [Prolixibacteraceae bacterium]MBT6006733.1 glyoxalase/bleomycin resistance/extradiol dioxygenase family protein [Prolixibacteraceae bacterium]MBT6765287.1 glyoxalase/bleomycin resistance/extradiol dioxygenase family protein [Prolixibacteraceae bacterium]MBT6996925.1 glyoxalase/bleomycin resistance/extradiol dioxygenase family protein [Prolixibacteraceae bacterium]MBT7396947.1 glyoxalase/bleomycin resistance/extradiol dioxyg